MCWDLSVREAVTEHPTNTRFSPMGGFNWAGVRFLNFYPNSIILNTVLRLFVEINHFRRHKAQQHQSCGLEQDREKWVRREGFTLYLLKCPIFDKTHNSCSQGCWPFYSFSDPGDRAGNAILILIYKMIPVYCVDWSLQ